MKARAIGRWIAGAFKTRGSCPEMEDEAIKRQTYTIEETARIFGIGRNQAYAAAGKEIPIIRIGKRKLVPRAWVDNKVSGAAR